uniref:glycosyltransferase n=1 Tax=Chloroflexus sp. TaxID=1904827 RepID=UPI002ACE22BD
MPTFSVIIPVLNEADHITTCVHAVRRLDPAVEVIVADGGSHDETPALARVAGARVVLAPRG